VQKVDSPEKLIILEMRYVAKICSQIYRIIY
jgi:hypothetical protein